MRFVSYRSGQRWRAGVVVDGRADNGTADVVDCWDALAAARRLPPDRPTVRTLLEEGLVGEELQEVVTVAARTGRIVRRASLGPPVPDPDKVLCFGINYREHADEAHMAAPSVPVLFAKFPNSLVGPGSVIELPATASDQVDYEGELAVVVGRTCRDVDPEDALGHLAGAMALNDVSARDLQLRVSQWTSGKAIDTFAPCGPELVTLDELAPLDDLVLTTRINGEVVQHASTSLMIFSVAELVSFLSRTMTLVPGDIISTGTPAGVGFTRVPPLFLRDGDVVEVEIDGVGVLRNPVAADRRTRTTPG